MKLYHVRSRNLVAHTEEMWDACWLGNGIFVAFDASSNPLATYSWQFFDARVLGKVPVGTTAAGYDRVYRNDFFTPSGPRITAFPVGSMGFLSARLDSANWHWYEFGGRDRDITDINPENAVGISALSFERVQGNAFLVGAYADNTIAMARWSRLPTGTGGTMKVDAGIITLPADTRAGSMEIIGDTLLVLLVSPINKVDATHYERTYLNRLLTYKWNRGAPVLVNDIDLTTVITLSAGTAPTGLATILWDGRKLMFFQNGCDFTPPYETGVHYHECLIDPRE